MAGPLYATDPRELVVLARGIALGAHGRQVDKVGERYTGHLSRVAARLTDPVDQAVAWLHDVLEDTPLTWGDLHAAGIPAAVCQHVAVLTHQPNQPRADYYARIRRDDRALRVKLADIADNSDPDRLVLLDDETRERLTEKYRRARTALLGDTT